MSDRARQFMPFAALKGYYDLIKEEERIKEPRREISEDDARTINKRLLALKKSRMVRITYYDKDSYVTTEGMLSSVNFDLKSLVVVKTEIHFDDIIKIKELTF